MTPQAPRHRTMAELTDREPRTADETSDPFVIDAEADEVLRLHLESFDGPMELLLHLIRVQEIDIFDIPIVTITDQYLRFLEMMRDDDLDVTGEFLVMAATLVQIKSRMLLPLDIDSDADEDEEEEDDPRLELVTKLLEYRRFREIARALEQLEDDRANWFVRETRRNVDIPDDDEQDMLEVSLYDLTDAFRRVLRYFTDDLVHTVVGEGASVDEKIEYIGSVLDKEGSLAWTELFLTCRSRVELVCCFLAILELCRIGTVRVHQHQTFGEIRLFRRDPDADPPAPPPTSDAPDAPDAPAPSVDPDPPNPEPNAEDG